MRVAHLSKVTGIAGSEGHLLRLLPGLQRQGVDIHMMVLEEPRRPVDQFCQQLNDAHIPVERAYIRGHIDAAVLPRLKEWLQSIKPDIVHTHLLHADLYGLLAARLAGVSHCVSSRHNDDAFRHRVLIKALNRWIMRYADRVVAISDALAHFVAEVEGIHPHKIVTIHYGYEAPPPTLSARTVAREGFGFSEGDTIVGATGRLIRQKGMDILIRAFALVLEEHGAAQLVIVGDGPERQSLEELTSLLGIGSSVRFLGWVDDAAQRVTPALDVAVVPSRWEGFGLVTLEAMGWAVPVIASRVSALPEIVVDGQTGYLVPPDNPKALLVAMPQSMTLATGGWFLSSQSIKWSVLRQRYTKT
jgi:glycosyltransferase involved in cell wall biosynthesis